jgi:hypothetical protein
MKRIRDLPISDARRSRRYYARIVQPDQSISAGRLWEKNGDGVIVNRRHQLDTHLCSSDGILSGIFPMPKLGDPDVPQTQGPERAAWLESPLGALSVVIPAPVG